MRIGMYGDQYMSQPERVHSRQPGQCRCTSELLFEWHFISGSIVARNCMLADLVLV